MRKLLAKPFWAIGNAIFDHCGSTTRHFRAVIFFYEVACRIEGESAILTVTSPPQSGG